MTIKILTLLFIIAILYNLASALYFLVRDHGKHDRMIRRLTWRVGLSLVLFLLLWGAYQIGWIEPSSGPVRIPPTLEQAGTG